MPTPWKHWEKALYFLLSKFPLHQLTTEAALQYRVRDNFTIVDPHPPEDAAEYQITTNTKFSLSLDNRMETPMSHLSSPGPARSMQRRAPMNHWEQPD